MFKASKNFMHSASINASYSSVRTKPECGVFSVQRIGVEDVCHRSKERGKELGFHSHNVDWTQSTSFYRQVACMALWLSFQGGHFQGGRCLPERGSSAESPDAGGQLSGESSIAGWATASPGPNEGLDPISKTT